MSVALSLQAPPPLACVFDLDGTLVDNMALHIAAFGVFVERHGLPPLTLDDRRRFDGKRNLEIFPELFNRQMADEEWRAYEDEKEGLYRELSRGHLQPLPGMPRFLAHLERSGIGIRIATAAPRLNVEHTLREIGFASLLPSVVRCDEVPNGKPSPDVFVEAARRGGVDPAACIGFEDALIGCHAVRAAGMRLIAVATTIPPDEFRAHPTAPDMVIRTYDDVMRDVAWARALTAR